MDGPQLVALYRAMAAARLLDAREEELAADGEVAGCWATSDRDGVAALAFHLAPSDWLFTHVRDRVLTLLRGIPPQRHLAVMHGRRTGRNECRASAPFLADLAKRTMASGAGGAGHALHAVGAAAAGVDRREASLAVCILGDGASRQGEFLEAVAEAVRERLPVLFVIETDGWDRSVELAGRTPFMTPEGNDADSLLGAGIVRLDARDPLEFFLGVGSIVSEVRRTGRPQIVLAEVDRRDGCDSSDDPADYLDPELLEELASAETPMERAEEHLRRRGYHRGHLEKLQAEVARELEQAEQAVLAAPLLPPFDAAGRSAAESAPSEVNDCSEERFGTLREQLGSWLAARLRTESNCVLLTPHRVELERLFPKLAPELAALWREGVREIPSSEATLVGTAIGRALAGQRPMVVCVEPEPLSRAYHQLHHELAALAWRYDGGVPLPLSVLTIVGKRSLWQGAAADGLAGIARGGNLSVYALGDVSAAAHSLRRTRNASTPTLLLASHDRLDADDSFAAGAVAASARDGGAFRVLRFGRDVTFVGWGSGIRSCLAAAAELEQVQVAATVVELFRLQPLEVGPLRRHVEPTAKVVIAPGEAETAPWAVELAAALAEASPKHLQIRRVAPAAWPATHRRDEASADQGADAVLAAACDLLSLTMDRSVLPQPPEAPPSGKQHFKHAAAAPQSAGPYLLYSARWKRGKAVGEPQADEPVRPEDGSRPQGEETSSDARPRVGLGRVVSSSPGSLTDDSLVLSAGGRWTRQGRREDLWLRSLGSRERNYWSALLEAAGSCLRQEGLEAPELDLVVGAVPPGSPEGVASRVLDCLPSTSRAGRPATYDLVAGGGSYWVALRNAFDYLHHRPHGRVMILGVDRPFEAAGIGGWSGRDPFALESATATVLYGANLLDFAQAKLFRPEVATAPGGREEHGAGALLHESRSLHRQVAAGVSTLLRGQCARQDLSLERLSWLVPQAPHRQLVQSFEDQLGVRAFTPAPRGDAAPASTLPLCLEQLLPQIRQEMWLGLCVYGGVGVIGAGLVHLA